MLAMDERKIEGEGRNLMRLCTGKSINIRKAGGRLTLAVAAILGAAFLQGCGEGPSIRDIPSVSRTFPPIYRPLYGPCPSLSTICGLDPEPIKLEPPLDLDPIPDNLDLIRDPVRPYIAPDLLH